MRPIPIPDWIRRAPFCEGTAVFSAPDGDLTSEQVPATEGLFFTQTMSGFDEPFPMVAAVLELDDADLEAIRNGARHVILPWVGRRMPVFVEPFLIWEDR